MTLLRLTTFITLVMLPLAAFASPVKVKWHEPENYADVRGADEHDKRFQKRVFSQLEKHLAKLGKGLPEGIELEMTVTDVNLAGDVRYSFSMHREIRLVQSLHFPRINFDYTLTNNGQLIDKGSVELKDMAFMDRATAVRMSNDAFKYDKALLTRWFKKDLTAVLAQYEKQTDAVMTE